MVQGKFIKLKLGFFQAEDLCVSGVASANPSASSHSNSTEHPTSHSQNHASKFLETRPGLGTQYYTVQKFQMKRAKNCFQNI